MEVLTPDNVHELVKNGQPRVPRRNESAIDGLQHE